jgi:ribosomal protein L11 methyltransferase
VPPGALALFERALEVLKGAIVVDGPDPGGQVPLSVYLAAEPERREMTALLAAAAAATGVEPPSVLVERLPDVDWVAESQKALPPLRVGRFYLYGSHVAEPVPPASVPIRIDANVAFGTGRHGSTKGCLLALEALAKRRRVRRALDLGCGSGVLAIAIAKLWACPVLAADLDPDSVTQTRANARANRAAALVRAVTSDGYRDRRVACGGPYDLIAANILAEPLAAMAGDLARHLAPGGAAVLSGLLNEQEPGVRNRHRGHGLRLARRVVVEGWTTLVMVKGGGRAL